MEGMMMEKHTNLRRLGGEEPDYLTPPMLTPAQIERIYGANVGADKRERSFGRSAFSALCRRAARQRPVEGF